MVNTGIIITMAYPETIVMVADEWYSPYLKYLGIGKKDYLRAGHAALVLINKDRGELEYHDFGRYITKAPNGRVRGKKYDRELDFPLKAVIENNKIQNLNEILLFLASNPELTHGDGKLLASICNEVDYEIAKKYISKMQRQGSIRYAAFKKNASNCARFVTTTLIAGVTNLKIRKKLISSQWFTPSTIGNVVLASSDGKVYEVTPNKVSQFTSTVFRENRKYFLDRLKNYQVNLVGTIQSKDVKGLHKNTQWLSGIAAGAWYELTHEQILADNEFRMRRISPYGNVDIDAVFKKAAGFDIGKEFKVIHNSNCAYCTVKQNGKIFCLEYLRDFN
ncbi:DUF6695 family protein [Pseudofulvibacter geojedonensis]|uniref:DUF6695 family protein n=1 Tax=Pseudofulvibacter geojedonensis TaxID=1123758 RepID=A0ABW3I0T2_9FLAO